MNGVSLEFGKLNKSKSRYYSFGVVRVNSYQMTYFVYRSMTTENNILFQGYIRLLLKSYESC